MVEPYTPAIDEMLTITPPVGCCIICLPAHLQPRNTPLRLIWITVFQPLTEMSSGLARNEAPALLTITSRWPHSWLTRATMALTCSSWRTSSAIEKAWRPRLRISFSTGSRCSSLRLQIATSAPARANSMAMDLPMPVPPPVTIAVLPSNENALFAMAGTIPQNIEGRHGSAGASRALGVGGPYRGPQVYCGNAISDWRCGTSRSMRRHTPIDENGAPLPSAQPCS